ncbi:glycosyltransferase family 4 protein [Clostridium sp. NSJ-49]|uniref:glycosyltransferase family 4 protein n=1 Tax=Clostridium sp. NSJ-49 TaxID=2763034 RepID=UPI00164C8B2C|nr:glycosyltransferase family 4 protein [Clostridium sp. NSJ-49]MBC5624020.1 glycosyltransferase family 4 protein [Clostridium sp. NSJ-49]
MKKVLYVTTVSRTINAFLVPHIEMLLANGYKVDCACSIDKTLNKKLQAKGVRVFEIPFSRNPLGLGNIKAFNKLIDIQSINEYDVIHVHTPIAAIYGRLLRFKFPKIKTIYTAHGYHFLKSGSKLGWLIYYPIEKFMASLTNVTININKEDYEITKNKLNPEKCYLMNGVGIDLNKYKKISCEEIKRKKEELGLNEDDFIVLNIAELNKNKNHIQLIKAMELLKDKYPNIKALCVGDGQLLEEIKKEIKQRGLEENIKLLGYREDINELINVSDIGILMSHREGLPRNLVEFMACGRNVIATNIRGCREIVCNESIGSLVEVGNYKETAKEIERYYLLQDKKFEVSEDIEKYNIKNINDKLKEIYSEVCNDILDEKIFSYM